MKDNKVAELVNKLNKKVRTICPDAPHQLRECIRIVVINHFHEHYLEQSLDGTYVCKCGACK